MASQTCSVLISTIFMNKDNSLIDYLVSTWLGFYLHLDRDEMSSGAYSYIIHQHLLLHKPSIITINTNKPSQVLETSKIILLDLKKN